MTYINQNDIFQANWAARLGIVCRASELPMKKPRPRLNEYRGAIYSLYPKDKFGRQRTLALPAVHSRALIARIGTDRSYTAYGLTEWHVTSEEGQIIANGPLHYCLNAAFDFNDTYGAPMGTGDRICTGDVSKLSGDFLRLTRRKAMVNLDDIHRITLNELERSA